MKRVCPSCGHKISFYIFEQRDQKVCKYCGTAVYKDEKTEFKCKLRRELKHAQAK